MSNTRTHIEAIELPAKADDVFALLHTPSAICHWWKADRAIVIPRNNGVWAASWGTDVDDPQYISAARISVFDPPRLMVLSDQRYYAKTGGPSFTAQMSTIFEVVNNGESCVLRVVQDGFPADSEADDFYADCQTGWQAALQSLKQYIEGARVMNDQIMTE